MGTIFKYRGKYRAQVRRRGHPTRSAVFTSKQAAQQWARTQEVAIDRARSVPAALATTLGDLVVAFRGNERRVKGSTFRSNLKLVEERLGHVPLAELNKQAVFNFVTARENEGAGPATVAQNLSVLRAVLRYGAPLLNVDEAGVMAMAHLQAAYDVLRYAHRVGGSRERDRRPTDEELARLEEFFLARQRSTVPMWDIVLFAICTAMRLGEIVNLQHADYDAAQRTIVIRERKDPREKYAATVPLLTGPVMWGGEVVDPCKIIETQRSVRLGQNRVFPYSTATVGNTFRMAVCIKLITDLHFHDLRHDGISRLFEANYSIPEVALISGHKSWKHLQRYTQIRPTTLHRD